MTTIDNSETRRDAIRLCFCLVFVCGFLLTVGFVLLSWIDEGPDIQYNPRHAATYRVAE